ANADRVCATAFDRDPDASAADHLRYGVRLDDADPRRPGHGAEVFRRLLDLLRSHGLGVRNHQIRVRLPRLRAFSQTVTEIVHRLNEVRHRQAGDAGVFLWSLSVRIVAGGRGPDMGGLPTS